MDKQKFVNHLEEMVTLLKEKKYMRRWKNEYVRGCINTLNLLIEDIESGTFDMREDDRRET